MVTKTKLTITIDKDILKKFDNICNIKCINKSKLLSLFIFDWCEKNNIINEKNTK